VSSRPAWATVSPCVPVNNPSPSFPHQKKKTMDTGLELGKQCSCICSWNCGPGCVSFPSQEANLRAAVKTQKVGLVHMPTLWTLSGL
jgi:hypothetical protein